MEINDLIKDAHKNAVKHGFWEEWDQLKDAEFTQEDECWDNEENKIKSNLLMLIVCEAAEANEALRKGDIDNFKEELADIAIRLADMCGGLEIDLEYEIKKKMEKNKLRPYKHGKAF